MSENSKQPSAPYATFGSFVNFLNSLRETNIPSRIDPSIFSNTSGSIRYSVLATLKSLNLIDADDGTPSVRLIQLIRADDEERKPIMATIIREGYPALFNGQLDLKSTTAGQFDEHIRDHYGAKGSTIDKVAAFFISAAKFADLEISPHLKRRKPIAASPSSRKSSRQRKIDDGEQPARIPPAQTPSEKPLQYQLVDLMSDPNLEDEVRDSIITLIQYLAIRERMKTATDE